MRSEINPIWAVVAAVVLVGVFLFAFAGRGGGQAPRKTTEQLRQQRPSPKIPPLESGSPGVR
jgi:hypothetical protein